MFSAWRKQKTNPFGTQMKNNSDVEMQKETAFTLTVIVGKIVNSRRNDKTFIHI